MKRRSLFVYLTILLSFVGTLKAQNVSDILSKYTDANGQKFIQPVADVFGASMNTGLFSGAYIPQSKFTMSLSLVTMVAFIPESKKSFMAVPLDDNFGSEAVETSTIFGSADGAVIEGPAGMKYYFPGGFEMSEVPYAAPQLTIGSLFGTDLTVRFFQYDMGGDFGKLKMSGFGVRHSVSQYFENLPVDLAFGVYYQAFKMGTILDATSTMFSAQASKDLSVFTFYGGLAYEKSTFDIEYVFDQDTNDKFYVSTTGGNSVRLTLGVKANLGPVRLNVDYNLADQSVLSAGLGFAIGDRHKKVEEAKTVIQ
jgi:hypothetical protein